jgi:serine/threonine protein kinase
MTRRTKVDQFVWNLQGMAHCQRKGEAQIAWIIVEIVSTMHHIHVQRFIHRDLNPRHVLLDWNWNIQICDFGF